MDHSGQEFQSPMELGTPPKDATDGDNHDCNGFDNPDRGEDYRDAGQDGEENLNDGVFNKDIQGLEKMSTTQAGDFGVINWMDTEKGNIVR